MGDIAAMDILQHDLKKLRQDANLQQSIQDVDKIIEQLERAREQIVESKQLQIRAKKRISGADPPLTVKYHRA